MNEWEQEISWAAGLFEGEGTIGVHHGKHPRLQCSSTDLDTLQRFCAIVGGRIGGPYKGGGRNGKDHWKPYSLWSVHGDEAIRVMGLLLPWLGLRRTERWKEVLRISGRESESRV
jgi:hypothetical protein